MSARGISEKGAAKLRQIAIGDDGLRKKPWGVAGEVRAGIDRGRIRNFLVGYMRSMYNKITMVEIQIF